MGVFEHFPYVNFHELNFSWMIAKIKELEDVIGSQIVDIVARAGVAANAQAIQDLSDTVDDNAITAHNESDAAYQLANTANGTANSANSKADTALATLPTLTEKTYTVTTTTNAYVAPFGAYATLDISTDRTTYGEVVEARAFDASTDPCMVNITGNTINVYSKNAATVTLLVVYTNRYNVA